MPETVLDQYTEAVAEYANTGMSILELPHRSHEFIAIVNECNSLVKDLCQLDDSYEIMWIQGGGRLQFCMVPMNFLGENDTAGYIDSGNWAAEAAEYAMHYGNIEIVATSRSTNYDCLPEVSNLSSNLKYLHLTTNNTIFGTQYHHLPDTDLPIIADMSSDIFGGRNDYNQCALFYAAVQKNIGTPGLALVVAKKNMLNKIVRSVPPMLNYKAHADQNSILHTANVSGQYVCLLMLRWMKEKGMAAITSENREKAKLVYQALDRSNLFIPHVQVHAHRSLMNVTFTAIDQDTENQFLTHCDRHNITGIKGHRSVGGFRVSLYNPIPLDWVETLVRVMEDFEKGI